MARKLVDVGRSLSYRLVIVQVEPIILCGSANSKGEFQTLPGPAVDQDDS